MTQKQESNLVVALRDVILCLIILIPLGFFLKSVYCDRQRDNEVIVNCKIIAQELNSYFLQHDSYPWFIQSSLDLSDNVRRNSFTKELTEPRDGMVIYAGEIGYNPRIEPNGQISNYVLTGMGKGNKILIEIIGVEK